VQMTSLPAIQKVVWLVLQALVLDVPCVSCSSAVWMHCVIGEDLACAECVLPCARPVWPNAAR